MMGARSDIFLNLQIDRLPTLIAVCLSLLIHLIGPETV